MYNRGVSLSRAVAWNINERDVCRALSFGNLFFLLWMEFFLCQNSVFWLVLLTGIPMNNLFARALSFGNLFFLFWMDFFYAKTQFLSSLNNRGVSLSCVVDWNVNERFVCTSREFWQLIFLVVDLNFFLCQNSEKS